MPRGEKNPPAKAARSADDLANILVGRSIVGTVSPADLESATEELDEATAEDAAARFLMLLPKSARPSFVFCDHHVERSVVEDLDRALDGELALRIDKDAGRASFAVSLLANAKVVGTHTYDDTLALLSWVQTQLVERNCEARLFYLPCFEGTAALVITDEQCEALREDAIPIEIEPPLY